MRQVIRPGSLYQVKIYDFCVRSIEMESSSGGLKKDNRLPSKTPKTGLEKRLLTDQVLHIVMVRKATFLLRFKEPYFKFLQKSFQTSLLSLVSFSTPSQKLIQGLNSYVSIGLRGPAVYLPFKTCANHLI